MLGMEEEPPMTAAESATALLKHVSVDADAGLDRFSSDTDELQIDGLNTEKSGTFDSFHGKTLPW